MNTENVPVSTHDQASPITDTASSPVAQRSAGSRRYELDWLRIVVVLGLIPYHVAIVFAIGPGDYIQNSERNFAFDVVASIMAYFGMPLLFFVAGAATAYALKRRSPTAYLGERLRRLAVPLIFGVLVLVPIQLYVQRVNTPGYSLTYPQFYRQFLVDWTHIGQIGIVGHGFQFWGHLWFLILLLAVSLILLPLLSWLRRAPVQAFLPRLTNVTKHPLGLLLLGVPLALIEVILKGPIGPYPLADYSNLYSGAAGPVLYAVVFVFGFLLVPDETFHRTVVRYRTPMLVLGVLLIAAHELVLGAFGIPTLSDQFVIPTVRLLRGMIVWCLLVAALGFASRYLTADTRLVRSLNEAAFPLYVLHMPVMTVIAYYVVRWEAPPLVKFLALITLTAIGTYALYNVLVRRTSVTRFLFGLKPKPATPPGK